MVSRKIPVPFAPVVVPLLFFSFLRTTPSDAAEEATAVESRIEGVVELLASDDFEGRGIGTKGIDKAADFIAKRFRELGLRTELFDGTPFQKFSVSSGAKLGEGNAAVFAGDGGERIELRLGEDYSPLAIGGSGPLAMPLVFAGYGISSRDANYDDYAEIDVKGKAVIILRHEPQQNNPHSAFEGRENSRHATFATKVSNAYQHGAAGVIFVTDQVEIDRRRAAAQRRYEHAVEQIKETRAAWREKGEQNGDAAAKHHKTIASLTRQMEQSKKRLDSDLDDVFGLRRAGEDDGGRKMPVIQCCRKFIDRVLANRDTTLAKLEKQIDATPQPSPKSFAIHGWRIEGRTVILRKRSPVKNVIAVLEGEGPLAHETVLIGAHYDHLGFGGAGSATPEKNEVHNGADDNASGTAVLLEVARQLAQSEMKPARRIVFIAFTGEERGLLGSAHYVKEPLYPLDGTVAMINMDMVGRLQDNKLIVNGVKTGAEFEPWVKQANDARGDSSFHLILKPDGFGPSDHATFYGKKIPVLHFFTGSHKDYHKPTDDTDKVQISGMRRIGELVIAMAQRVANHPTAPKYQEVKSTVARRKGSRPYFGSIPDFGSEAEGYALAGVAKDSPAERAGIQAGDVVIGLGDNKIGNLEDIDGALRKFKAGDKVRVTVKRGEDQLKLDVILDPPR